MAKIHLLPKSIYNRIAAGEVVDRPYSAVKELVENAIDAGATQIEIRIEGGGKQLIQVSDNGCGIEKDDLNSAFLPHATSKIERVEDLDFISTLGFRGEALASISAISKTQIISVTEGNPAYKIDCDGGVTGEIQPAALEKGTVITVRDLFYNTPVRAKFLKPEKKEEADVTAFVSRYILSKPYISFKYYADGKLVLQSFGGGPDEALAQVYGAKTLSECFKIDAEKDEIHIYGFIGNQNFFKSNKNYQSIFLNGRYIVNSTIATAISNAYASYAMRRQFPFYVLNVDVPLDFVDVNVHPNKADVRFLDNRRVFGAVYGVISAILDGKASAAQFIDGGGRIPEMRSTIGGAESANRVYGQSPQQQTIPVTETRPAVGPATQYSQNAEEQFGADRLGGENPENEESMSAGGISINSESSANTQSAVNSGSAAGDSGEKSFAELIEKYKPERAFTPPEDGMRTPPPPRQTAVDTSKLIDGKYFDVEESLPLHQFYGAEEELAKRRQQQIDDSIDAVMDYALGADRERKLQQKIDYETCRYRGNLFDTYLLYEYHNKVYIIDQHAAHERLIFDKLIAQVEKRTVNRQPLLIPYFLEVSPQENLFLQSKLEILSEIGFTMSEFGSNAFRIDEVPADLQGMSLKEFFAEILSQIDSYKEIKLSDILREKLASTACKHAIKGGMQLTDAEVDALFRMLEGNVGLKCPHGRPICVILTRRAVEKMFKRIV